MSNKPRYKLMKETMCPECNGAGTIKSFLHTQWQFEMKNGLVDSHTSFDSWLHMRGYDKDVLAFHKEGQIECPVCHGDKTIVEECDLDVVLESYGLLDEEYRPWIEKTLNQHEKALEKIEKFIGSKIRT